VVRAGTNLTPKYVEEDQVFGLSRLKILAPKTGSIANWGSILLVARHGLESRRAIPLQELANALDSHFEIRRTGCPPIRQPFGKTAACCF
jgi:hypothetical protein